MGPPFILIPLILTTLSATQREYNPLTLLEITSPANGAIVEPGQRLTVTVNSTTVRDAEFGVISPLGISGIGSTLPGRVILDIKKDAACGRHPLTAMGTTRGGQPIVSDTIEIDVERSDTPISLTEANHMSRFHSTERGADFPLLIVASFADGTTLDVRESTRMNRTCSRCRALAAVMIRF